MSALNNRLRPRLADFLPLGLVLILGTMPRLKTQAGLKRQRAAADLRLLEDKAREVGAGLVLFGLLSGQLQLAEAFPETALRELQTRPAIPYGKQVTPNNRFHFRAANARKLIAAVSRSLNILSDFERPRSVAWIVQNLRRDRDLQQAA